MLLLIMATHSPQGLDWVGGVTTACASRSWLIDRNEAFVRDRNFAPQISATSPRARRRRRNIAMSRDKPRAAALPVPALLWQGQSRQLALEGRFAQGSRRVPAWPTFESAELGRWGFI